MACTVSLPLALTECVEDCSVKIRHFDAQGKVTWVGEGIQRNSFQIGGVTFTLYLEQMPKLISVGNTVKISFDGQNTFIEQVNPMG